jgi:multisubunit Na+/H+ antiporter MnhE subunit
MSDLAELALGDGHLNDLLREVHGLEFLLLLQDVVDFTYVLLIIGKAVSAWAARTSRNLLTGNMRLVVHLISATQLLLVVAC